MKKGYLHRTDKTKTITSATIKICEGAANIRIAIIVHGGHQDISIEVTVSRSTSFEEIWEGVVLEVPVLNTSPDAFRFAQRFFVTWKPRGPPQI